MRPWSSGRKGRKLADPCPRGARESGELDTHVWGESRGWSGQGSECHAKGTGSGAGSGGREWPLEICVRKTHQPPVQKLAAGEH